MPVAGNASPGEDSVRCVQSKGNESARSEPITNERAVRSRSLLSKPISGDAGIAGNREKLAIGTARSVPRSEKNSRTGNGAGGLIENR